MNPVIVGTIFWIIIAIVVGWKINKYIGEKSPLGKEWQNQKIGILAYSFSVFQMWLMWATCYMHQMYPLIEPKIQF